MSVDDPDERYFGVIIGYLQYYGKIGLTNTGGVSHVRVNGNLSHRFDTSYKKTISNGWREYSTSSQKR